MGNYKPPTQDVVQLGGWKHLMTGNDKVFHMTRDKATVGWLTFHKQEDDLNYQVPTGKKAIIVFVSIFHSAVTNSYIKYADNLDGGVNGVTMFSPAVTSSVNNLIIYSVEAPEDKYINHYAGGVALTATTKIFVLERDA